MVIKTSRKAIRRVKDGAFWGEGGTWAIGVVNARFYSDEEAKDLALYIPELRDGRAEVIDIRITYDFDE